MRTKLAGATRPSVFEWIIVSRWGSAGEYLSIGWTSQPVASKQAPINLTPRHSVLGIRRERTINPTPATFVLIDALPDRISVAGEFLPAEGYVRLHGKDARLRLRSMGRGLVPGVRPDWHIAATRAGWIGEFIEPASR